MNSSPADIAEYKTKSVIVALLSIVIIAGSSFAISYYHTEQSKPDREQTLKLANAAYDRSDFQMAAALYERYLHIFDSTDANVQVDYSFSVYSMGRREDGIAMLKALISKNPENAFALFNLAVMYFQMKQIPEAKQWLQRCAENKGSPEMAAKAQAILQQLNTANP
jgi:tetratricopeptide (TPR) repeat protein